VCSKLLVLLTCWGYHVPGKSQPQFGGNWSCIWMGWKKDERSGLHKCCWHFVGVDKFSMIKRLETEPSHGSQHSKCGLIPTRCNEPQIHFYLNLKARVQSIRYSSIYLYNCLNFYSHSVLLFIYIRISTSCIAEDTNN